MYGATVDLDSQRVTRTTWHMAWQQPIAAPVCRYALPRSAASIRLNAGTGAQPSPHDVEDTKAQCCFCVRFSTLCTASYSTRSVTLLLATLARSRCSVPWSLVRHRCPQPGIMPAHQSSTRSPFVASSLRSSSTCSSSVRPILLHCQRRRRGRQRQAVTSQRSSPPMHHRNRSSSVRSYVLSTSSAMRG